jgi:hypothetical protein
MVATRTIGIPWSIAYDGVLAITHYRIRLGLFKGLKCCPARFPFLFLALPQA